MVSQDEILEILVGQGTVSRKDLCKLTGYDGGSVSKPIMRLEKHGYIKVECTPNYGMILRLVDREAALRRLGLP